MKDGRVCCAVCVNDSFVGGICFLNRPSFVSFNSLFVS